MSRYEKKSTTEMMQEVVDGIVHALEGGYAPWFRPWNADCGFPRNGGTGRHYNGINIFALWAAAAVKGYADQRWYTFDQAMELNGFKAEWVEKKAYGRTKKVKVWTWAGEGDAPCEPWACGVKKGEKSTAIVWAGTSHKEETDEETGEVTEKFWRTLKVWRVFNHAQIVWAPGQEPQGPSPVDPAKGYEAAAGLFEALPCDVRHGGSTASYSPKGDYILLPQPGAFENSADYWSTRAHETVHWTGHKNRCHRSLDTRFGTEAYAYEELVAELGAAFLCAKLGIEGKLQHESYIASWIKVLKSDTKALFQAASLARKAVEWVTDVDQTVCTASAA